MEVTKEEILKFYASDEGFVSINGKKCPFEGRIPFTIRDQVPTSCPLVVEFYRNERYDAPKCVVKLINPSGGLVEEKNIRTRKNSCGEHTGSHTFNFEDTIEFEYIYVDVKVSCTV